MSIIQSRCYIQISNGNGGDRQSFYGREKEKEKGRGGRGGWQCCQQARTYVLKAWEGRAAPGFFPWPFWRHAWNCCLVLNPKHFHKRRNKFVLWNLCSDDDAIRTAHAGIQWRVERAGKRYTSAFNWRVERAAWRSEDTFEDTDEGRG